MPPRCGRNCRGGIGPVIDATLPRPGRRPAAGGAWRERFHAWMAARQPRTDTLLLTQRNVYILPTPAGWMFALTLVLLLLAAVNYQLNLGYLLTFLLAGSGLVSMHLTHATLRGLTLHLKPVDPLFAGTAAALDLVLTSPGAARHGIGLKLADAADTTRAWIDVPALGQAAARLAHVAPARGRHTLPAVVVETRFPFGLFRAWTVWRPAASVLVYPRAELPAPPLPAAHPLPHGQGGARRSSGGEADGVRAYRRGDPLRQIAWKKTARAFDTGGELVSRATAASAERQLWLDATDCGLATPEGRLSRLAAWVLSADRAGLDYGLRLPGTEIAPAAGEAHRRRCLEALALCPA